MKYLIKPLQLVKCTIFYQSEENIELALNPTNAKLFGTDTTKDDTKYKIAGTSKRLIHTSFISPYLSGYSVLEPKYGLIFETHAKPLCAIPFDLDFIQEISDRKIEKKEELIKILTKTFRFINLKKMINTFPSSHFAIGHLKKILKEYNPEIEDLEEIFKRYDAFENSNVRNDISLCIGKHNEVIFEEEIPIKPIALFGSETRKLLKYKKIKTNLRIYSTINEFLAENYKK